MSVLSVQAHESSLLQLAETVGDERLEQLVRVLHQELKRVARRPLGRAEPWRTLETTDVVHDAYRWRLVKALRYGTG